MEPNEDLSDEHAALVERFLAGDSKERKAMLPEVRAELDRAGVAAIAETVRDRSPRVSSRVTAMLAKHALDDLFEASLRGLKPGKIDILRTHYAKIRRADDV